MHALRTDGGNAGMSHHTAVEGMGANSILGDVGSYIHKDKFSPLLEMEEEDMLPWFKALVGEEYDAVCCMVSAVYDAIQGRITAA